MKIFTNNTNSQATQSVAHRNKKSSGMTLIEVIIAMVVLVMLIMGVLGLIVFARTLTEKTIMQNTASAAIQSYIEQIKSIPINDLPYTKKDSNQLVGPNQSSSNLIPVTINGTTPDTPLVISTSTTIPALHTINVNRSNQSGGVANNLKYIDVNNTPNNDKDDMVLNIRIWIRDISIDNKTSDSVRAVIIQYAWRMGNPNASVGRSSTRTIISSKPSA